MRGILEAKLAVVTVLVGAFSGCVGYDYEDEWRAHDYDDWDEPDEYETSLRKDVAHGERDCSYYEPTDPLHLTESRTVVGEESKRWSWKVESPCVRSFLVRFAVDGATDRADAVAVCFTLILKSPKGKPIAEMHDTAVLGESQTVLNWSVANATVPPGQWSLVFRTTGALHYDARIDVVY